MKDNQVKCEVCQKLYDYEDEPKEVEDSYICKKCWKIRTRKHWKMRIKKWIKKN